MKILITISILLTSCVHYKVNRIGRHEQIIEVSSIYGDRDRLIKYSKRKIKLLGGCSWYEFVEKSDYKIVLTCNELKPYRDSLYDR